VTKRIYLISGPRNLSTALMYSFRQRADTTVWDEPLYGHFLRVTGVEHPGGDEVVATTETDGEKAIREIILGDYPTPVAFFKSMGHHTAGVGLDLSFLDHTTNVFLTRSPEEMITSFIKNVPNPTADILGLPQQVELLDEIVGRGGSPIVVDSRDILRDPPGMLSDLCDRIGIPWDEAMLTWPAGPKPEDGCWGKYWYHSVWKSTGWQPYRPKTEAVPGRLGPLLDECTGYYERLMHHAIRPMR
jgi:hypothetical protein